MGGEIDIEFGEMGRPRSQVTVRGHVGGALQDSVAECMWGSSTGSMSRMHAGAMAHSQGAVDYEPIVNRSSKVMMVSRPIMPVVGRDKGRKGWSIWSMLMFGVGEVEMVGIIDWVMSQLVACANRSP